MNYQNIHDRIINRAKSRSKPDCYCENHHIIPTCMDGIDSIENKVFLTGREHFIIHILLAKLNPKTKLVHAPWKMACHNNKEQYGKITSRIYSTLRQKHAETIGPISSKANKQKVECPWCKKIGGIAIMGRWHFDFCKQNPDGKIPPKFGRKPHSGETKQKMKDARDRLKESGWISPAKGKKQDSEAQIAGIEKMKQIHIASGRYKTPEIREKQELEKDIKRQIKIIICPHCNKIGGKSIMKRWHFDNCKQKGLLS